MASERAESKMSSQDENQVYANVWDALADTPAEAENLKLRSRLMREIRLRFDHFGWSQNVAAQNLGVTQPRISDLVNGKINKFSLDTLINMAAAVGVRVDVSLHIDGDESKTARELQDC